MMNVTFYGHSCFMVEMNGAKLLFDPFITGNEKAAHVKLEDLNPDYILLTHAHADHVLDAEVIAKQSGAKIISNYEIVTWYQNKGIENVHPLNHGGGVDLDFGRVRYVQAVHTSSFMDGSYGGQPGGFVVSGKEEGQGCFYHSGDTALHYDMKLIAERYDLDFAMLCIGDNFTMDAQDAARAADFIGTGNIIGMHYDTFPPIEIAHDKAKALFADKGHTLTLMEIGETLEMPLKAGKEAA